MNHENISCVLEHNSQESSWNINPNGVCITHVMKKPLYGFYSAVLYIINNTKGPQKEKKACLFKCPLVGQSTILKPYASM